MALNTEEEPPKEAFKSTKVLEKLRALFLFPLVEADVGLSLVVLIDIKLY